jgi:hypothetical protein
MNRDEYVRLFHKLELNLVAFKRLLDCDEEVLKLVNAAIAAEREECAKTAEAVVPRHTECGNKIAFAIRERGAP